MAYCMLKPTYITTLRMLWDQYCDLVEDEIERVAHGAFDDAVAEANEDIRKRRYSTSSVQGWLDNRQKDIYAWRDDFIQDVEKKRRACHALFIELGNKKMHNADSLIPDVGKRFVLSLLNEKITFTYANVDPFSVKIDSIYMEGNFGNHKFKETFNPPTPQFTEWFRE